MKATESTEAGNTPCLDRHRRIFVITAENSTHHAFPAQLWQMPNPTPSAKRRSTDGLECKAQKVTNSTSSQIPAITSPTPATEEMGSWNYVSPRRAEVPNKTRAPHNTLLLIASRARIQTTFRQGTKHGNRQSSTQNRFFRPISRPINSFTQA